MDIFKNMFLYFNVIMLIFVSTIFSKSTYFSLDMETVNFYWHRTAIMTLLRAKANAIMKERSFPELEKVIYGQCNKEAKTPSQLAKCIAPLLDTRDQINYQNGYISEEMRHEELRHKFLNDLKYLFNIDGFEVQKRTKTYLKPVKEFYKRKKREIKPVYKNVENLRIIQHYLKLVEKCQSYLDKIKKANDGFLKGLKVTVNHQENNPENNMVKDLFKMIENFQTQSFAILSPRILPFLPSKDRGQKLISPTLFSFNHDGFLPLPDILKSTHTDKSEQDAWLDMLLEISGTSKKLKSMIEKLQPTIDYYEKEVLPAIYKMEELEKNYALMKRTLSFEQRIHLERQGYAFLNSDQLGLIYGKEGILNISAAEKCSKESLEVKLEDDIRKLAKFDTELKENIQHSKRFKRQDGNDNNPPGQVDVNGTTPDGEDEGRPLRILRPWAFLNRLNEGVVLEAVVLSPHAFFLEMSSPEFMVMEVLSPRAFQPAILSPAALLSRILTPSAFGVEILSPRAFVAYVLSPEVFTAEILSPQFFEAHIASPEAFTLQILSPNIVGPRIGSDEANSILILSPNILSPRLMSKERMMIEILSPHVLGGEETEEEEESNLHSESELPEAHKYHNHSRGRFGPPGTEHEHPKPISFFPFG